MSRLDEGKHVEDLDSPNTLPRYLTSFVGRGPELVALKKLLASSRLLTITGPGGAGKSRLAVELARVSLDRWPDGVSWVDLAAVDDPAQVPAAVLSAMDLPGQGPPRAVVAAWLAPRRALLLIDNCEHLVAGCAQFCGDVLSACPHLNIVTTSREALLVPGEVRWSVPPMSAVDAVNLFEARGRLGLPDFKVDTSNRAVVTDICERLDRMPLTIELAAARVGLMTAGEIHSRLSNRFSLLRGGSRTVPQRQQTMLATLEWSYRLLSNDEAKLFRRLSVFRGGFTLDSARAVGGYGLSGDVLDSLIALVLKSMVMSESVGLAETRYHLLESQLAYAEELLHATNESEVVSRRHYEYFLAALIARNRAWTGPRSSIATGAAEEEWKRRERANLWAAVGWARRHAEDLGLSLAVELAAAAPAGGHDRARQMLTDLLNHSSTVGATRADAMIVAAYLGFQEGDSEAALSLIESAIALARTLQDPEILALALHLQADFQRDMGNFDLAEAALAEALGLLNGSRNRVLLTTVRSSEGFLALSRGDYAVACDILAECVAASRAAKDEFLASRFQEDLASAQLCLGDYDLGFENWTRSLATSNEFRDLYNLIGCLEGLACVAAARGEDARATRIGAAASRLSSELSLKSSRFHRDRLDSALELVRSRAGVGRFDEAWKQGFAMTLDRAVEYALGDVEPESQALAGPLTPREQAIARLVAQGLSNHDIAEKLFISDRTAETHVQHIFNKLGFDSRAQIAAWVVRQGLALDPVSGHEDASEIRRGAVRATDR